VEDALGVVDRVGAEEVQAVQAVLVGLVDQAVLAGLGVRVDREGSLEVLEVLVALSVVLVGLEGSLEVPVALVGQVGLEDLLRQRTQEHNHRCLVTGGVGT